MHIIILGAGEVGFNIAQRLVKESQDIVLVDQDAQRLSDIADKIDVRTVEGQGSLPSVLRDAGADNAELLIAVTASDEINMLACQVAHSIFKIPTKMARIRQRDYLNHHTLFGQDELPIDQVISPEQEAADAIIRRFYMASAVDSYLFADGTIQLLGVRVQPKEILAGLTLFDLKEALNYLEVFVVAVEHRGNWRVPNAETVLLAGDTVYFMMAQQDAERFIKRSGRQSSKTNRNVMIVGGGNIGGRVSEKLENDCHVLKIIEHNSARSRWLAEHLNKSIILCGDALDHVLLEEENIEDIDVFFALTNDDETNILSSLLAKRYGVPHIVTLVNRSIYSDLVHDIGLDITISPRLTTVSSVLRHVRKGRVLDITSLGEGEIEVLEAEALETCPIVGIPIQELVLPKHTLIGAILRDDAVIIPNGDTQILPRDRVVIATRAEHSRAVEKLFQVKLEFF